MSTRDSSPPPPPRYPKEETGRRNKEMTSNQSNDITGSAFIPCFIHSGALRGERADYFQGIRFFKWLLCQAERAVDSYNIGRVNRFSDMSEEASSPVSFNQSDPVVSKVAHARRAPFPHAPSFGAR